MIKLITLFSIIALLSACNNTTDVPSENSNEIVTNKNFVALEDIQAKGAELLDKEIQTQGIVDHVCKHSGKKILLVGDGVDIHVISEDRFEDDLIGKEITITAIVKEDRTDEATLLQIEEDAINSHSDGEEEETRQERIISYVNTMRDSLENAGVDYFSEYYLEFISYEETNVTIEDTTISEEAVFVEDETPEPAVNNETPTSEKYQLIVGSFINQNNAIGFSKTIEDFDFQPEIIKNKNNFRVVASSYSNIKDAKQVRKNLKEMGLRCWINISF